MIVPRTPGGRLGVDQDAASHWSKRGLGEVKEAVEELPCRDPRVEGSLLQKIESELSLRKEEVPEVRGKGRIHSGQDGKEVVLESLNRVLSRVRAMHVRRD
jgi:hypothetical protein